MPRRGPPRLSIFTLKSATWRACGHALDLPRARSAAPLLQNLIVCCCCAIQAPRRPGLGSRGVRRRSIPRLDSAMEVCSVAHSHGCKAHRSNIHRLSHPRSRCSHDAAPSGWAGRLPAAELPWSSLFMRLARPLVRGARVAAAKQRAGAQEDRMEVASPSPRPWSLLCCEGPLHAGLGFSA